MSTSKVNKIIQASRQEALVAVKLYNEPMLERSLEGFTIHMHLAWLYLLQAENLRDNIDMRYPHKSRSGWFEKIDGEYRLWDLEKCVKHRWPDPNDAIRANLEFYIRFRNKTEHRHQGDDSALLSVISDKSQAMLLNYEEELVAQFSSTQSLGMSLRFPVFIGTFSEPAIETMKELKKSLSKDMQVFLSDYDAGLDSKVINDPKYSMRLKVSLQAIQNGKHDLAIDFVRESDLSEDELTKLSDVGKTGTVVVRQQTVSVANDGLKKFNAVILEVNENIPFKFNQAHLQKALRIENVRPASNSPHPERTRVDFCTYDSLNNNYGYSQSYVNHLIIKCSTRAGFTEITGTIPVDKPPVLGSTN